MIRDRVLEGHILNTGFSQGIDVTSRHAVEEGIEELRTLRYIAAVEISFPLPPVRIMEIVVLDVVIADIQTDVELLVLQLHGDIPVKLDIDMMLAIGRVLTRDIDPIGCAALIIITDYPVGFIVGLKGQRNRIIGVGYDAGTGIYQQVGSTASSRKTPRVIRVTGSTERGDTVYIRRTASLSRQLAEPHIGVIRVIVICGVGVQIIGIIIPLAVDPQRDGEPQYAITHTHDRVIVEFL